MTGTSSIVVNLAARARVCVYGILVVNICTFKEFVSAMGQYKLGSQSTLSYYLLVVPGAFTVYI